MEKAINFVIRAVSVLLSLLVTVLLFIYAGWVLALVGVVLVISVARGHA